MCPHMGVLFQFQEVRIVVVSLGNTFVILLVLEVRALLWGFSSRQDHICHIGNTFVALGTHLSHWEHVCRIGNMFVVTLILEVHALLWGFSSHQEGVRHVICHPTHSIGSCPPMGVLFEFWEVQVVIARECVHHIIRHPTHSIGFCPPVGVLLEFQEVRVIIILSGTHLSCHSLSHSFRFIIWPSLSVSNA